MRGEFGRQWRAAPENASSQGVPALSLLRAKSSGRNGEPGESLTGHLWATAEAAAAVQRRIGRLAAIEGYVTGGRFWDAARLAALTHDAGKISDGFQDMVYGRTPGWGERHEVLSLGFLPPLIPDPEMRMWVASMVATHHRALASGAQDRGRDLLFLYGQHEETDLRESFGTIPAPAVGVLSDWLRGMCIRAGLPGPATSGEPAVSSPEELVRASYHVFQALLDRWEEPVSPDEGLAAVLLQGVVTMADRLSSAHGTLDTTQPLGASFRPSLEARFSAAGHSLRTHQTGAAEIDGHLLLRAPTGSGKTESALLWAARQAIELAEASSGVPRVFYTLPYLSSINAMTGRLVGLLRDLGLIEDDKAVGVTHSRAASYHLVTAIAPQDGSGGDGGREDGEKCRGSGGTAALDPADAADKAVSRAAATQLFRESLRVGTPYQLLRAALAGPQHSSALLDTANSVFVLDELHAYDPERLGFILASARMWEKLGGRIAVLSATLPAVLQRLFRSTLAAPARLVTAPESASLRRHRLRCRGHHLTDPAAVEEMQQRLAAGEAVLVVANNVAHALELYEALAPTIAERHGEDAALLLHSRFKRSDRAAIEHRIRERFETRARNGTETGGTGGLLVATQVVEVSLDVDFDVLFTAAAPLEALLQRFGRVNRIAARPPADVIVHQPAWTTRRGTNEEFADGIYPRTAVEGGWELLTTHDGATVDESDATRWLDEIYAGDWGEQWHEEVLESREAFAHAFLRFTRPFDDREDLSDAFDKMFEGTEAILEEDRTTYERVLTEARGTAGRLLADDHLIPLPYTAARLARWDRSLKVRIVDGDYCPRRGLLAVRRDMQQTYQPGEIL